MSALLATNIKVYPSRATGAYTVNSPSVGSQRLAASFHPVRDTLLRIDDPGYRMHVHEEFRRLRIALLEDVKYVSSSSVIKESEYFGQVLRLGRPVLSEILTCLQTDDVQIPWFLLLRRISGENPVPAEHRGLVFEMARDWIDWGKANQLIS